MAEENMTEKGMSVFLDVFRRADKNDDGFISWDEFVGYFADGVMGKEELQTLFNEIDTHNTNNIDTQELCSYFATHLGDFKQIYGTMEDLMGKVTGVLFSTSKSYEGAGRKEKFVTRFLMREIQNQLTSIQKPLEAASEELDLQARRERADIDPIEVESIRQKAGATIPGRVVRRAKRQISSQSTGSEGGQDASLHSETTRYGTPALTLQVDRLENLIDKLENKVNFDHFIDEEVVTGPDNLVHMLQRDLYVKTEELEKFRASLKAYVESIQGVGGCLNVSVRSYGDSNRFSVYEIWDTEANKKRCSESDASRTFVKNNESHLEKGETTSSMTVPASWWRRTV